MNKALAKLEGDRALAVHRALFQPVEDQEGILPIVEAVQVEGKPHKTVVQAPVAGNYYELFVSPYQTLGGRVTCLVEVRDVTEDKAKEAELTRIMEERASQTEKMMAIVTHDLRQPHTLIRGYASSVARQLQQPQPNYVSVADHCRQIAEAIRSADERLSAQIKTILYSESLTREVISLAEVLSVTREEGMEALFRLHNIKASIATADGNLKLLGNIQALQSTLSFLITNSVRAMEKSKLRELTISLEVQNRQAMITIADTGKGIPLEFRGRIFEGFTTNGKMGTGIGLPYARATAIAHGGNLELKSSITFAMHRKNPKLGPKGTIFILTLPLMDQ
ncbi:HAMP domain-containing histidine kinase [Candidatus Daviesbacteria bacterium]|nr:HAMP domain-containing histidine kinase [Candidatus Daviesbacteria bacterium]